MTLPSVDEAKDQFLFTLNDGAILNFLAIIALAAEKVASETGNRSAFSRVFGYSLYPPSQEALVALEQTWAAKKEGGQS